MRHYCNKVPICLIVDGDIDVSDLEREYNLIVLRVSDLPSAEMRKLIGGNYRAKLAAMWEGPFEYYVWLDSDAILWGDITSIIKMDSDFHIFSDALESQAKDVDPNDDMNSIKVFSHYAFHPYLLKKYDSKFKWKGSAYFCSGAFAARRNLFSFQEWKVVEEWNKATPGLFGWGEMGMLNYIIHSKKQRGEITIAVDDIQHIRSTHGLKLMKLECANSFFKLPQLITQPRILHFCGGKPWLFSLKTYCRPFTLARLTHEANRHGIVFAWIKILLEDVRVLINKCKRRLL
jgi:hypothetical protein